MKVLLDECLPVALRQHVTGHDTFTVTYMGWSGIKNGNLIARAAGEGFDAIITSDQRIDQHAGAQPAVSLIIMHAKSNDLSDLTPLIPHVLQALATLTPQTVVRVS